MTARILIAGPDPAAAQSLSARFAALGHEVAGVARTTDDAIAASAESAPDLIVLDASLAAAPGGRRAVELLRRTASAPILFLAAEDELAAVRAAGMTARDGIVVAPFTERDLRLGVETTLLRRDAASEAQELEERFFAISIDMLCFLGFDGYFRRLNPAWERTLGFTVDELRSRPFIEFVHPDDRERTLRQNAEVRAGGRALGFENRYLCKDGTFRWLFWNAAPDPEERVIYSVARDITARKQAEEERERLVGELQSALAEVNTLREFLPICSYCRKIRDDENYWMSVESYISTHTNTQFSHGICPSCMASIVDPEIEGFEKG
jgi:PAS domain S-box-containing protein